MALKEKFRHIFKVCTTIGANQSKMWQNLNSFDNFFRDFDNFRYKM